MKRIILIPGLGADSDLFRNIDLKNFDGFEVLTLNYFKPGKKETLKEYGDRLIQTIPDGENAIIIGVSFGGILAQEISKNRDVEKVILVSSISSMNQKPFYFFIAKILPLHKVLPEKWLKGLFIMFGRLMTTKSPEDRSLFESMVSRADIDLVRWGIDQTLNWKQGTTPKNIVQIHGSGDRLFPIRKINPAFVIEGGEHFMIVNRSDELNPLLNRLITA